MFIHSLAALSALVFVAVDAAPQLSAAPSQLPARPPRIPGDARSFVPQAVVDKIVAQALASRGKLGYSGKGAVSGARGLPPPADIPAKIVFGKLNNEDGCSPLDYVPPPTPSTPKPLTNAQRIAQGLAVRPPTPALPIGARDGLPSGLPVPLDRRQGGIPSSLPLGRRQGGIPSALPIRRQVPSPLPNPLGRRQIPSPLPNPLGRRQGAPVDPSFPVMYHGSIVVKFAENNTIAGYVAKKYNRYNEFSITQNTTASTHAHVTIDTDRMSEDSFNIVVKKPVNPDLVNLGAVIGPMSSSASLGEGSANYAILVGSDESAPGATPSKGRTTAYGGSARESAIWKINPITKQLDAHWINEDSKPANASILMVEDFFVLSDGVALASAGVNSTKVFFFLE